MSAESSAAASAPGDPLYGRNVPFLKHLQIRPVSAEPGRAVFECTVDDIHLRTLGLVHGGVLATLLDTAMGYAAGTRAREGYYLVTVQLAVNFTKPAVKGDVLSAIGEVQHSGQRTAVVRGEIRNAGGDLVATGSATFMFLPRPGASS